MNQLKQITRVSWRTLALLIVLPASLHAAGEPLQAEIAQPHSSAVEVPFNEKELKAYTLEGRSSITGVAFGKTQGGDILCSYLV